VGLLGAAVMIFPLYVVFVGGFKTKGQVISNPFGLPNPWLMDAYRLLLGKTDQYWSFLYNSVVIAALTICFVVVIAMMASVAITRISFKGSKLFYNYFVMGMLFPLAVAVLPLYLLLRNLGLTGSFTGVVFSQVAFSLPMGVFIFSGFFKDVPAELQDACAMDGGGIFTFFLKVIIPISTPVIATVSIITFVGSWNSFLLPLLVINDSAKFPLPLGVMQFQGQFSTGYHQVMAFMTLSILPMALFYFAMQKYIVSGLTAGAIKG
jgi:raffinose/stachyose/melibiose transport system permease protein